MIYTDGKKVGKIAVGGKAVAMLALNGKVIFRGNEPRDVLLTPAMTSDMAPYPWFARASSTVTTLYAFTMFNQKNNYAGWASGVDSFINGVGDEWAEIYTGVPIQISRMVMISRDDIARYGGQAPKDFELLGSNDYETWDSLLSVNGLAAPTVGFQPYEFSLNTARPYLFYRIRVTRIDNSGSVYQTCIGQMRLFGEPSIDDYLISPEMSSPSTPAPYEVTASSNSATAFRVFNRSYATGQIWASADRTFANDGSGEFVGDEWISFDFSKKTKFHRIVLQSRNSTAETYYQCHPKDLTVEISQDAESWTPIRQFANITKPNAMIYRSVLEMGEVFEARHIRLRVTKTHGRDVCLFQGIEVYGPERLSAE